MVNLFDCVFILVLYYVIIIFKTNFVHRKILNTMKLYLFFILVFLFSTASAVEKIRFSKIGLEEGLSNSTVVDILQDMKGKLWVATYNGLCLYDGYEFVVYHHNDDDSLSVESDVVRSLDIDSEGRIWVGTSNSLSVYNSGLDNFENFIYTYNDKPMDIWDIVCLDKNDILVATDAGLKVFNSVSKSFYDVSLLGKFPDIRPRTIRKFGENVYIGAYEGLYVYSLKSKEVRAILKGDFSLHMILSILELSKSELWMGTEGDGLYRINPINGEYTIFNNKNSGISSDYIRSLSSDMFGCLWIGTLNALNIYNQKNDSFTIYNSENTNDGSLSHTSVRSLYKDMQGGMWVGTYFGGLNYYHPLSQRFTNIRNIPYYNSLSDNVVSCIVEDEDLNLWIGTNDGGINRYNPEKDKFVHYTVNDGLTSNDIKAIYIDSAGQKIYVGSHALGGLDVIDKRTGKISNYRPGNEMQTGRGIYGIQPVKNGKELVCASVTGSIVSFDINTKEFKRLKYCDGKELEKRIVTIYKDSLERLWVGTIEGVRVYEIKDGILKNCNILPQDNILDRTHVNVITKDSRGHILLGTRKGLYIFDEKQSVLKNYTVNDGLPNNVVHGILEDDDNNIWISTDRGLSCYNPSEGQFRNFTDIDGIQSNQFTPYSYCKSKSGKMYFGGINGITVFNPSVFPTNPFIPSVMISDLQIMNKSVRPDDNTGVLTKHISETKNITLKSDQTMISLYFTVADYISGKHNQFAYKLEGLDDDWVYTDNNKRSASYSNLAPGNYCFMVKASNRDGVWNDNPTKLYIKVLPAWYATWWAKLIYVMSFIGISVLVFRYFWMKKSMRIQLEMERVDKERIKEVNEMKLRFFINISHELRTPLTLIIAPLADLLRNITDKAALAKIKYINTNANRLLYLVNQLMDYRRAELGVFKLKVKKQVLDDTVSRIYRYYETLAVSSGIEYRLENMLEGKEVLCDTNYIELILNNLLSNSFKYTPSGGSIVLKVKEENGRLLFEVSDTGQGIPVEKQKFIFERFYQVDNNHVGSGIGLSLVKRLVELHHGSITFNSALGEGCTFFVNLPSLENAYTKDEISSTEGIVDDNEQVYSTNSQEMYLASAENHETEEFSQEETSPADEKKSVILVVEDNIDIQNYLADGLSGMFDVIRANNGKEALEVLENQSVNLILSDVMMPLVDGIKLCRDVKRNIKTCHIPVIMLSAKTEVKEQLEGLKVGADDYISKPFYMEVVLTKIRNILRTYSLAIEHYSQSTDVEPDKLALNPLDKEFLEKAVAVVKNNLDSIVFSADLFASEMNMSRSTLHLKMKAITGESTTEFIRKIRLSEACKLLKEGKYTITEVSEMVGFNTPAYFATSFKKYMGCMPSEYVKKG